MYLQCTVCCIPHTLDTVIHICFDRKLFCAFVGFYSIVGVKDIASLVSFVLAVVHCSCSRVVSLSVNFASVRSFSDLVVFFCCLSV